MRWHFTMKEYSMRKNCIMTVLMYPNRDVSRVDGSGIRSGRDHYEVIDAAENFQMDEVGQRKMPSKMTSQKAYQMQCMRWLTRARKEAREDSGWCSCYHYTGHLHRRAAL